MILVALVALADEGQGAPADEAGDDWGDDDDVGFGELPEAPPPPPPPKPLSFGGSLRTDEALWVERLGTQPVAKARQTLDLELGYKRGAFRAGLSGHGELDPAVLLDDRWDALTRETYGWRADLRDAWAALAVGPFEITLGRQEIAWGEGLMISPVDVIAPRDLREPGLADLDDVRLPVTAARLAAFAGAHRLEGIVVVEADFGLRSPPAGPFGPLPALLEEAGAAGLVEGKTFRWRDAQPRFSADGAQAFARWSYKGPGIDLAAYAGTPLDRQGVITLPDPITLLTEDEIDIELDHRRYDLVGTSGSKPVGSWLLRWELAAELGRPMNTGDPSAVPVALDATERAVLTGMVGAGFSGIPHTTVDVEVAQGWLPDRPDDLLFPLDATTYALRLSHAAFRNRLLLEAVGVGWGHDLRYGGLARVEATVELRDAVHASVGAITYRPGHARGPLLGLDTHDRVYAQGRWDF